MLGLTFGATPKFSRQYAHLGENIASAVRDYCDDVRGCKFPSDEESYHTPQSIKGKKTVPIAG
jgi:3-methyl-2-oxobutanoate hydroxymethyltransferase